jgi:hypothetical protein
MVAKPASSAITNLKQTSHCKCHTDTIENAKNNAIAIKVELYKLSELQN